LILLQHLQGKPKHVRQPTSSLFKVISAEYFGNINGKNKLSAFLRGLTLIFLRMLENLIQGSLRELNERKMFQMVFKELPCYK